MLLSVDIHLKMKAGIKNINWATELNNHHLKNDPKSRENEFIFDQNCKNSEMGGNWVDHKRWEQIRLTDMQ